MHPLARPLLPCTQVRSLLLDYFRGQQVESINLKGLDRAIFVSYLPDSKRVLFRQYHIKHKKSGGWRVGRMDQLRAGG